MGDFMQDKDKTNKYECDLLACLNKFNDGVTINNPSVWWLVYKY